MSSSERDGWPSGGIASARAGRVLASLSEFLKAIREVQAGPADSAGLCDFMAGTPQEIAPRKYVDALKRWAEPQGADWFGYKMAHRPAQEAAAAGLAKELD